MDTTQSIYPSDIYYMAAKCSFDPRNYKYLRLGYRNASSSTWTYWTCPDFDSYFVDISVYKTFYDTWSSQPLSTWQTFYNNYKDKTKDILDNHTIALVHRSLGLGVQ